MIPHRLRRLLQLAFAYRCSAPRALLAQAQAFTGPHHACLSREISAATGVEQRLRVNRYVNDNVAQGQRVSDPCISEHLEPSYAGGGTK